MKQPLLSTSANSSGSPPCMSAIEIFKKFGQTFPVFVGKLGVYNKPSEIKSIITGDIIRFSN